MIVAFTGHRPPKLIGGYDTMALDIQTNKWAPNVAYVWVREQISNALQKLQPKKAISGMALGVDQWSAEICIERSVPFIAAVPFKGHEKKWPQKSQEHYHYLLSQAAEVEIVCDGTYKRGMYQVRDEWMVDRCDTLIAVWDGTKSGTKNTIDYAKEVGREIYMIDATQRPTENAKYPAPRPGPPPDDFQL